MNFQKNLSAYIIFGPVFILIFHLIRWFTTDQILFEDNFGISVSLLLITVLFLNYKNAEGKLKYTSLNHFLDRIFPKIYFIFLIAFLVFVIYQIVQTGILSGEFLFSQIIMVFAISVSIYLIKFHPSKKSSFKISSV